MTASEYAEVQRDWTREEKVYEALTTALLLRATLLSPAFLDARDARFSTMTGSPPPARPVGERVVVFTVASQFPLDLGVAPPATWTVRVFAGDTECAVPTLEHVTKPTEIDRALYPMTQWDELWIARVPSEGCGGALALDLRGPHGHARAHWAAR